MPDFRSFICYRKKNQQERQNYAPSEDVAGLIGQWIDTEPALAPVRPVLFEDCCYEDINFDESGIRRFMPGIDHFFVVICPDFFREVIDIYKDVEEDIHDMSGPVSEEAARELLQKRLRRKGGIYYLELLHALEQLTRDICLYPVYVNYGDRPALLTPAEQKILEKIFGEGILRLLNRLNSPVLDYTCLESSMAGFSWGAADPREAMRKTKELERLPAVSRFKEALLRMLTAPAGTAPSVESLSEGDVQEYLKKCTLTINATRLPSLNNKIEVERFRAGNPDLIYDPLRMHHDPNVRRPLLAQSLIDAFREEKEAFQLPTDRFAYWNVGLDLGGSAAPDTDGGAGLSVCAICFGTLITNYRLKKDTALNVSAGANLRSFRDTVDAGLSLLIALRNPYTKTWPSQWVFDNSVVGIDGTINQTTVSLSTLLSCDFLTPFRREDGENVRWSPLCLESRYRFLWESVECLLDTVQSDQQFDGEWDAKWSYTYDEPGHVNDAPALLPTLFVFDTLLKTMQTGETLLAYLKEGNDPVSPAFLADLEKHGVLLQRTLDGILRFLSAEQKSFGEQAGAFRRFSEWEYSVTHTACVIKSLYNYRSHLEKGGQTNQTVEAILDRADRYLLDRVAEMQAEGRLSFQDFERYENFFAKDPDDKDNDLLESNYGETYEHCAELILAEALIKIAGRPSPVSEKAYALLCWLLHTYLKKGNGTVEERRGQYLLIRGTNPNLPYPIYYAYYFRMVMSDYLLLLKKRKEEKPDDKPDTAARGGMRS